MLGSFCYCFSTINSAGMGTLNREALFVIKGDDALDIGFCTGTAVFIGGRY